MSCDWLASTGEPLTVTAICPLTTSSMKLMLRDPALTAIAVLTLAMVEIESRLRACLDLEGAVVGAK